MITRESNFPNIEIINIPIISPTIIRITKSYFINLWVCCTHVCDRGQIYDWDFRSRNATIFVTVQTMNRFFYRQIFVCFGCSIYGGTIADSYRNIRIGGGIKPVPWKRILISPWTVTLFNRVVSAIFVCNAKANASIDVFRCSMFSHVEVVI